MPNTAPPKLFDLPPYIYGTTRLGDESIPFEARVAIAREAYGATGWVHTSDQYGDALKVLRVAFDQDRSVIPNCIFKIGWSSVDEVAGQILDQTEALGIHRMSIGQLCPGGGLADDLRTGGRSIKGLEELREHWVDAFVMEVWPWTSDVAIDMIRNEHAEGLIDGFIFYLNPLQRFVSNELWDLLLQRDIAVIAMRTVAGGDVRKILANEKAPDYLRKRATEVVPILERSGIESWTEFAARYSLGFEQVRASVGATASSANLAEFLKTTRGAQPLDPQIVEEVMGLQRRWSEEHDRYAAPWSM